MSLLDLPRVPEPEVMNDSTEVAAYCSAAGQPFLERIDDTFVEQALRLLNGKERGRALDIGTGPGQIVIKLARRLTLWKFVGVDRSSHMIERACSNRDAAPDLAGRVELYVSDGNRLGFRNACFDLVICNSVLHHLAQPCNLLAEISRIAKPEAAILLRDLRRPSRLAFPFHIRWYGRRYSGVMRKLYCDSVRAAYTVPELRTLLASSPLREARVFTLNSTHLGIERSSSTTAASSS